MRGNTSLLREEASPPLSLFLSSLSSSLSIPPSPHLAAAPLFQKTHLDKVEEGVVARAHRKSRCISNPLSVGRKLWEEEEGGWRKERESVCEQVQ